MPPRASPLFYYLLTSTFKKKYLFVMPPGASPLFYYLLTSTFKK